MCYMAERGAWFAAMQVKVAAVLVCCYASE